MGKVGRLAIVGFGSIGRRHFRLIKQLHSDIEVVLVRSGKGEGCQEEAMAYLSVGSADEAIKVGIDAAIISSPASNHLRDAGYFLAEKIPLLIEKPLSSNLDGINQFKLLVDKIKVPVLVGYVLRYSEAARYFYKLVSSEKAGKLHYANIKCSSFLPDWRPGKDYRISVSSKESLGGGVLNELSHELDYANWFFGPFRSVNASLKNSGILGIEVEDKAEIMFYTLANAPISVSLDFSCQTNNRITTLYGSEGTITWDAINQVVRFESTTGQVEQKIFVSTRDDIYLAQLVNFFECIEKKNFTNKSLCDGISVLNLINAARQSNARKEFINL
jgi:predicted dehydrogenase